MTDVPIPRGQFCLVFAFCVSSRVIGGGTGTVVWEADVDQHITKVLTEYQLLALPPATRDAWLEYAWSLSNGYFVGPRLDLPLDHAKLLDASCFLNHSSNPALGFAGDYNLVAVRNLHHVK